MMRILFLSDGIYPYTLGGMQRHTYDVVKSLVNNGCHVTLVFCVNENQQIPSHSEVRLEMGFGDSIQEQFSTHVLKFPTTLNFPGHYIRESYLYSKNIFFELGDKLKGFDFIYAQGFTAWYLLKRKSKGQKLPLVGVNFHGLNMFQESFGWKSKMESKIFRFFVKKNILAADYVFSFGGKLKELYLRMGIGNKLIFHPIGINQEEISIQPSGFSGKLHFVFIGRFDKVKGLNYLFKAINGIPIDEFKFTFIGNIPESAQLKRKDCIYTGQLGRNEINDHLSINDVLICPSISEGMPFVILEAMSKGLVILATDVGAINEMVDQTNGILFSPGSEQEIRNAIQQLSSESTDLIFEKKTNSIMKSEKFVWDFITKRLITEISDKIAPMKK